MVLDIDTPHGAARVRLQQADGARAAVVLGHGAGGGVQAPDLQAAARAAVTVGASAALVEQPYRVAGRRSQPPASRLDAAWVAVITALREGPLNGMAIVAGGRSAGARVACRTSAESGAIAVLCLAFPLHPPGKANDPTKSRLTELERVTVPVLVVQGERDPFGIPPEGPSRAVARIPGNHSLRDGAAVEAAVTGWLRQFA